MVRRKQDNNSFESSMTDLMISLALIFMLLLASVLLKLHNQAGELENTKDTLITELSDILLQTNKGNIFVEDDVSDPLSLKIVLGEGKETLKFATGKWNLDPHDTLFLKDIMPKIIKVLCDAKYKNSIDSIRIEGYTDDNPYNPKNNFDNIYLSQLRALEVLNFTRKNCLTGTECDFFVERASVIGRGAMKKYLENNKAESRRVEIKIKIKSKDEERLNKDLEDKKIKLKKIGYNE